MLNIINGILFVQISQQDIENFEQQLKNYVSPNKEYEKRQKKDGTITETDPYPKWVDWKSFDLYDINIDHIEVIKVQKSLLQKTKSRPQTMTRGPGPRPPTTRPQILSYLEMNCGKKLSKLVRP